MHDPTPDLRTLLRRVGERDAMRFRHEQVRLDLADAQARFRDARPRLRSAAEALARTKGFSLAEWIASVRGTADERRSNAARVHAAARDEHDGALTVLAALEAEFSGLEAGLAGLYDLDEQVEAAVVAREAKLIAAGGADGAHAAQLAASVRRARVARDLVHEGAEAARLGSSALDAVIRGLADLEGHARRHDADGSSMSGLEFTVVARARTAAARGRGRAERLRTLIAEAAAALGEDGFGDALGPSRPLLNTIAGSMNAWMSPAVALEDGERVTRADLGRLTAALEGAHRARREVGRAQVQLRADLEGHATRAAALERERLDHVVGRAPNA